MQKILSITTLLASPALAAETWGWTAAENLCAGIVTNCNDMSSCTKVGVGPCEGSTTTAPTAYLTSEFVGMAFVDQDNYLEDTTQMKVLDPNGAGYRDYKAGLDPGDGGEFAYLMSGNSFGDMAAKGGYIGMASYLNTGTKDIKSNTNTVFVAGPGNEARKDRTSDAEPMSDSDMGAPMGPYKICISEVGSGGTCGKERVFSPSAYKFSIFGYATGVPTAGQDGFPDGMDHLGLRMKLSTVGFKVESIQVNGKAYDEASLHKVDVTQLSLMHSSGGINMVFPKKYNVGSTIGAKDDGETMMNIEATKDVKIHVHGANKEGQYVYIDYLFETAGFSNGDYFMYDPDVTEVKYTPPAASSSSSSSPSPASSSSSSAASASSSSPSPSALNNLNSAATMPVATSGAFAVVLLGAFAAAFLA